MATTSPARAMARRLKTIASMPPLVMVTSSMVNEHPNSIERLAISRRSVSAPGGKVYRLLWSGFSWIMRRMILFSFAVGKSCGLGADAPSETVSGFIAARKISAMVGIALTLVGFGVVFAKLGSATWCRLTALV